MLLCSWAGGDEAEDYRVAAAATAAVILVIADEGGLFLGGEGVLSHKTILFQKFLFD